jgi:hypothetical protein
MTPAISKQIELIKNLDAARSLAHSGILGAGDMLALDMRAAINRFAAKEIKKLMALIIEDLGSDADDLGELRNRLQEG